MRLSRKFDWGVEFGTESAASDYCGLRRDDRSGIVLFSGLSFGTRSARCGYSDGDRYRLCLGCFRVVGKTGSTQHAYFLTALAVVDDIGGIIIIALFYSGEIAFEPLLISLALLALLYVGGRMRVNNIAFYYIIGFFVWMLFLSRVFIRP